MFVFSILILTAVLTLSLSYFTASGRTNFVTYLQDIHHRVSNEDLFDYCHKDNFSSSFAKAAEQRYQNMTDQPPRIFVAINLVNNERILPNMAMQLLELADKLGHRNVFVSVYENGSTDGTKKILRKFNQILDVLRIPHHIVTDPSQQRPPGTHRIEYMAQLRNLALGPLYQNPEKYDRVLFLNDVYFCLADVLELLYQSYTQQAHLTCAEDFEVRHGSLAFYDTWVARDMLGRAFRNQYFNIADDSDALVGQIRNTPFQVQCCWNGMTVIDTKIFGKGKLRFRRSQPNECSASECSLLCNDMWGNGYGRMVVVPRVKVAYDRETREMLRRPNNFPRDRMFRDTEMQRIRFRVGPQTVYCNPLDSPDRNNPDGPATYVELAQS